MSDNLYHRRIYFDIGHGGSVVVPGIRRHITHAPKIPGLREFVFIDYAGHVYPGEIAYIYEARREMTKEECAFVNAWLDEVQASWNP